tara:strand:+ start:185 stop:1780 length:1596 start_codon:yes stop_codon:yes gene_type:complete
MIINTSLHRENNYNTWGVKKIVKHFKNIIGSSKINESLIGIANTLEILVKTRTRQRWTGTWWTSIHPADMMVGNPLSVKFIQDYSYHGFEADIILRETWNTEAPMYNLEKMVLTKKDLNKEVANIIRYHRQGKRGRVPAGMDSIAKMIYVIQYTNAPLYLVQINKLLFSDIEIKYIDNICTSNNTVLDNEIKLSGLHPIHIYAMTGNSNLFSKILDKDPTRILIKSNGGETVLGFAIIYGQREIIQIIYDKFTVTKQWNDKDISKMIHSKDKFNKSIIEYLYTSNNTLDKLVMGKFVRNTFSLDIDEWKKYKEFTQTINNELTTISTMTFVPTVNNTYKIKDGSIKALGDTFDKLSLVKYIDELVLHGANINNIIMKKKIKRTPLLNACIADNTLMAQILIEKGADINISTEINDLPLHWSINKGNLPLVKLLTTTETIVKTTFSKSDKYMTALKLAKQFTNTAIIEFLANYESNLDCECPVCWSSGKRNTYVVGKCNHVICAGCFSGMIRVNGYKDIICPYCRANFTKDI